MRILISISSEYGRVPVPKFMLAQLCGTAVPFMLNHVGQTLVAVGALDQANEVAKYVRSEYPSYEPRYVDPHENETVLLRLDCAEVKHIRRPINRGGTDKRFHKIGIVLRPESVVSGRAFSRFSAKTLYLYRWQLRNMISDLCRTQPGDVRRRLQIESAEWCDYLSHELQHFIQQEFMGLPGQVKPGQEFTADVEIGPNVNTEARMFSMEDMTAEQWIQQSEFFQTLKAKAPAKYRRALKMFMQQIEKDRS